MLIKNKKKDIKNRLTLKWICLGTDLNKSSNKIFKNVLKRNKKNVSSCRLNKK